MADTLTREDGIARLVQVLKWYGEQARLARLIHSEGDKGRHALAADGGKNANEAVEAYLTLKTFDPPAPPSADEIKKLQAFKDYVHQRLDEAGIPTHPDGPHSKEGCRVGDRLDLALGPRPPSADVVELIGQAIYEMIGLRQQGITGYPDAADPSRGAALDYAKAAIAALRELGMLREDE